MIKELNPILIQKIAAGEVIESPVSVVKELVENSIDANSTIIEIIIVNGGKDLIAVKDNGTGITKEDLPLSYKRHATSKINSENDLYNLATLGFRGEALASISSVSQMTIISKSKEKNSNSNIANEINVTEEKLISKKETSMNYGTAIIVKNLFYNLPVRKNFMKVKSIETRKIIDLVKSYALIKKNIHFKLIDINSNEIYKILNSNTFISIDNLKYSNKDVILNTPIANNFTDRATSIFGYDIAKDLIELKNISSKNNTLFLSGLISKPTLYRSTKSYVFCYVNNRLIENKTISDAVFDAYSSIISDKYPIAIINLTVPKSFVDVNVHPSKLTIKFADDSLVYSTVYEEIKKTLENNSLIPKLNANNEKLNLKISSYFRNEFAKTEIYNSKNNNYNLNKNNFDNGSFQKIQHTGNKLPKSNLSYGLDISKKNISIATQNVLTDTKEIFQNEVNISDKNNNYNNNDNSVNNENYNPKPVFINSKLNYKIIAQFANSYILLEKDNILLILDQHVVEERINYEKLKNEYKTGAIKKQNLLIPRKLNFNISDSFIVRENIKLFNNLSIDIEMLDNTTAIVRSLPYVLKEQLDYTIIYEMTDYLKENSRKLNNIELIKDEMIKQMACKASIKQGKELTMEYMNKIVEKLFLCENPYVCPHGRPVIIELSLDQLNKMFKRK